MEETAVRAHAKINLCLDVTGRRSDGYHDVRMIMQTVSLCDTLLFRRTRENAVVLTINRADLPSDGENLIVRAVHLLREEFGIVQGVQISLDKQIPVAAGLAGGSADAAAALAAVNRLFSLGLSKDDLAQRGASLGADVPYCTFGGTMLAEGIGERLRALAPLREVFAVIAKPKESVSTKSVYQRLILDETTSHPNVDGMMSDLAADDLAAAAKEAGNVLESVTMREIPVIARIKESMMREGALWALMSGSGPSVFGLFEQKANAVRACRVIKESGTAEEVFLTKTVQP